MLYLHGINNFVNNSAGNDGAEMNISLTLLGASDFSTNSAQSGSVIYTADNTVLISLASTISIDNSATTLVITMQIVSNINSNGCTIYILVSGGAMYTTILYLNNNFINKSAGFVDAISIFHSIGVLTFNGT